MQASLAATRYHRHPVERAQHHSKFGVVVEQGERLEFLGDTARPFQVPVGLAIEDEAEHDGVVGWIGRLAQWVRTLALAAVGVVALRGHDPCVPSEGCEVDVHGALPAEALVGGNASFTRISTPSPSAWIPLAIGIPEGRLTVPPLTDSRRRNVEVATVDLRETLRVVSVEGLCEGGGVCKASEKRLKEAYLSLIFKNKCNP